MKISRMDVYIYDLYCIIYKHKMFDHAKMQAQCMTKHNLRARNKLSWQLPPFFFDDLHQQMVDF